MREYSETGGDFAGLTAGDVLRGFRRRWPLFASMVLACWAVCLLFIFLTASQYEADTSFYYLDQNDSSRPTSGIAALASSVGFGGSQASGREVALAILQSRQLAANFVERYRLLPLLFPDSWDSKAQKWLVEQSEIPTLPDGAAVLQKAIKVVDDANTGVIKLTLRLPEQEAVAPIVNNFVKLGNEVLRKRTQDESQQRLVYLEQQLGKTSIDELRSSITSLIQQDMKLLTFSRTQAEFAFKIIDPAIPPKYPAFPRKSMLMAVATILALIAAGLCSVFLDLRRTGYFS